MGIDIYMRWDGMTEEDRDKQITGFDATKGDVGYLREASHGKIFATEYLVKEAFEEGADRAFGAVAPVGFSGHERLGRLSVFCGGCGRGGAGHSRSSHRFSGVLVDFPRHLGAAEFVAIGSCGRLPRQFV